MAQAFQPGSQVRLVGDPYRTGRVIRVERNRKGEAIGYRVAFDEGDEEKLITAGEIESLSWLAPRFAA